MNHNHLIAAGRDVQELTNPHPGGLINTGDWATVFDAGASSAPTFAGSNCPVASGSAKTCDWQASAAAVYGTTTYVAICGVCRATYADTSEVHSSWRPTSRPAASRDPVGQVLARDEGPRAAAPAHLRCRVRPDGPDDGVRLAARPVADRLQPEGQRHPARLMVSHDSGDTFTDLSGNLPKANVGDVIVRNHQPIIATDVGVFTATKGSSAWMRLGTGLPGVRAQDVRLDSTGQFMVAPMYGRGAWVYDFGQRAGSGSGVVPPTSSGPLATTGIAPAIGIIGLLLVTAGLVVRRRLRFNRA